MNINKLKIKFKYNRHLSKLYNILKYLFFIIHNLILWIIGKIFSLLLPIKNNKIVVVNYNGKGFGDNPKYIVKELLNNENEEKYEIVWLVNNIEKTKNNFPSKIKLVKNESLLALKELSTAKIWIDNTRKRFYPPKRKKQIYIQTWHAGVGMKKTGKDTQNADRSSIKIAMKDSKMSDLMISNSSYRTKIYRNSFLYNGNVLENGIPRNDILINHSIEFKSEIKRKLNIKEDTKVVLYAPTFRKSNDFSIYNIKSDELLECIQRKFGGEWIILARLHPYLSDFKFDFLNTNKVMDVTQYDDLSELLVIADMVISDYSSLIFDYSITNNPVFLFAKDYDEYYKKEGLNFTKEELPFETALNFEGLLNNIQKFNKDEYLLKVNNFNSKVGLNETGNSSKLIKKYIDSRIGE